MLMGKRNRCSGRIALTVQVDCRTAEPALLKRVVHPERACAIPKPGTGTFTLANYGPFAATNVVLTLGVPKQFIAAYAVQFSLAATCKDNGPGNFPDGTPFTQGDRLACTFASVNAGDVIQATVGFDSPPNVQINTWPTLNAYVSSDTPDTDLTNNAIGFNVYPPYTNVKFQIPPVPPSCKHDPDDHTFEVLIDTCGGAPARRRNRDGCFSGGGNHGHRRRRSGHHHGRIGCRNKHSLSLRRCSGPPSS